MNLYIMSRGRPTNVKTWANLPDSVQTRTSIVISYDDDFSAYSRCNGSSGIMRAPDSVRNYSDKFQWILDDGMGDRYPRCAILDDDLVFSERYTKDDGKIGLRSLNTGTKIKDSSLWRAFNDLENYLLAYPLVGFHPRQMGHTAPPEGKENGKVICVQGINRRMVRDHFGRLKVNQFPILADVVLNASILEAGMRNKILTEVCVDWGPCQAEGGCSLTRTPEMQREACLWLEERFGPYIKAVEKEAKDGWLGGKRVDFRGQWKKLYEAGASGILDTRAREYQEEERKRDTEAVE